MLQILKQFDAVVNWCHSQHVLIAQYFPTLCELMRCFVYGLAKMAITEIFILNNDSKRCTGSCILCS